MSLSICHVESFLQSQIGIVNDLYMYIATILYIYRNNVFA